MANKLLKLFALLRMGRGVPHPTGLEPTISKAEIYYDLNTMSQWADQDGTPQQIGRGMVSSTALLRMRHGSRDGELMDLDTWASGHVGGGGLFRWDAASTEADDTGIIIAPTGASVGRWVRVYEGAIHGSWFGMQHDTDNSTALQNALNALRREARAGRGNMTLSLPPITSLHSTPIIISEGTRLIGSGEQGGTTLRLIRSTGLTDLAFFQHGNAETLISETADLVSFSTQIRDLTIDANAGAQVCAELRALNENCVIEGVKFRGGLSVQVYLGPRTPSQNVGHQLRVIGCRAVLEPDSVGFIFDRCRRVAVENITLDTWDSVQNLTASRGAIGIILRGDTRTSHFSEIHAEDIDVTFLVEGSGAGASAPNTFSGIQCNFNGVYDGRGPDLPAGTAPRGVYDVLHGLWSDPTMHPYVFPDQRTHGYSTGLADGDKPSWMQAANCPNESAMVFVASRHDGNARSVWLSMRDNWTSGGAVAFYDYIHYDQNLGRGVAGSQTRKDVTFILSGYKGRTPFYVTDDTVYENGGLVPLVIRRRTITDTTADKTIPDVSARPMIFFDTESAFTVTDFVGGEDGQILDCYFQAAGVTIQHSGSVRLRLRQNTQYPAGAWARFQYLAGAWRELTGRSSVGDTLTITGVAPSDVYVADPNLHRAFTAGTVDGRGVPNDGYVTLADANRLRTQIAQLEQYIEALSQQLEDRGLIKFVSN